MIVLFLDVIGELVVVVRSPGIRWRSSEYAISIVVHKTTLLQLGFPSSASSTLRKYHNYFDLKLTY